MKLWPRLHLISFVVLIQMSGFMLAVNVKKSEPMLVQTSGQWDEASHGIEKIDDFWWGIYRGWPLQHYEDEIHQVYTWHQTAAFSQGDEAKHLLEKIELPVDYAGRKIPLDPHKMQWAFYDHGILGMLALGINALVALVIVGTATVVVEYLCRRFVYRKKALPGTSLP